MTQDPRAYDAALVSELNDMIQLDHDAVEAYTIALNAVRNPAHRDTLVAYRAEHKRHIEELGALVRARGGNAVELPHATGPFKIALQALAAATMNDGATLLAFKVLEGQVRDRYRGYATHSYPDDVRDIVRRAADDEAAHYRWVSETLRELGYGDDTAAGTLGLVLETVHKAVATPLEAMARQAMRMLDESRPRQIWREQAQKDAPPSGPRSPVVESFVNALRAVEERGDVEWMVPLFAGDATLVAPLHPTAERGPEGARRFWTAYRRPFATLRSELANVAEAPGVATVQWTTRGRTEAGVEVAYQGMSVIEHRDGKITRFQAYFDPAQLETTPPSASAAGPRAETPADVGAAPSGATGSPLAGAAPGMMASTGDEAPTG